MDGETARSVVNTRLAYIAISRASEEAQAIQDAERVRNELAKTLAEVAKTVAEGEGKAAVTRANGEAEANKIRQTSLTRSFWS